MRKCGWLFWIPQQNFQRNIKIDFNSYSKIYLLQFWSKREGEENWLDLGHIFQKIEIISSGNKNFHIFLLIIILYDKLKYSWQICRFLFENWQKWKKCPKIERLLRILTVKTIEMCVIFLTFANTNKPTVKPPIMSHL